MRALESLLVFALVASAPQRAAAAVIELVVSDGPNEGLNDATAVAPVGGNAATTLGAQRLGALQHAASKWAAVLQSSMPIRIHVTFDPLTCTATSATLGAAGPLGIWRDFPGAPLATTWYVSALANARAGSDLDPSAGDILMVFNSNLGTADCLAGSGFYLGLDGQTQAVDLVNVAEHEVAHGLGFSTFVDPGSGAELGAKPDAFERFLSDNRTGLEWPQLSDADRAASAADPRSLVFFGPRATASAAAFLARGAPVVTLGALGEVPVGLAAFGPPLPSTPLSAPVVAALDGGSNQNDACEPVVNDLHGKIALLDRSSCPFTTKVLNVQNAGAVAAFVIDTAQSSPPLNMGGTDPTVAIPSVLIPLSAGATLRAQLASGTVVATLTTDPTRRIGADAENHPLAYSPSPIRPGSSLSHWDPFAKPDLLMEPNITPNPTHGLDLTPSVMADLGWSLAPVPPSVPALGGPAALAAAALLAIAGALRSKAKA